MFIPRLGAEEANVKEAQTYRDFAADCIRIAKTMRGAEKETLLSMAKAWEERAREAERLLKKADSKK
jgi:hypothetical protein